jgi:hypothetical protein
VLSVECGVRSLDFEHSLSLDALQRGVQSPRREDFALVEPKFCYSPDDTHVTWNRINMFPRAVSLANHPFAGRGSTSSTRSSALE